MNLEQLKGMKVAVLGLGVEGTALANFLLGKAGSITLLDKLTKNQIEDRAKEEVDGKLVNILKNSNFEFELGHEHLDNLEKFDIIFRSPGIPYLNEKIQQARAAGAIISSQVKLFYDLCPCPIIGVTGTKGKGTTSSLIYEMLKKPQTYNSKLKNYSDCHCEESATRQSNSNETMKPLDYARDRQLNNVYLAGNIGEPAIALIDKLSKEDIVVLELSSFQLQDMEKSPHIAVVLNISVDHLDYHKDELEYKESKKSIVKYQTKNDYAVINQDYLTSYQFSADTVARVYYFSGKESVDQGAFLRKLQISNDKLQNSDDVYEVVLKMGDGEEVVCRSDEIKLIGKHNLENIAAASVAARLAGADTKSIAEAAKSFVGLPHRLDYLKEVNGVKFYDDSYATSPEPTMVAIDSFDKPIHLILGGSSKGADFTRLAEKITRSKIKSVSLIGDEKDKIEKSLTEAKYSGKIIRSEGNFKQIIKEVLESAKRGEIALLSPACASFGLFKNYKDRGEKFSKAVNEF